MCRFTLSLKAELKAKVTLKNKRIKMSCNYVEFGGASRISALTKTTEQRLFCGYIIQIMLMFDCVYAPSCITLRTLNKVEESKARTFRAPIDDLFGAKTILPACGDLVLNDDNSALYNKISAENKGYLKRDEKKLASARTGPSSIHLSAVSQNYFLS